MPMIFCAWCQGQSWRNLPGDPCAWCHKAPSTSSLESVHGEADRFRAAAALLREQAQESDRERATTLRREALHLEHAAAQTRWAASFVAALVQTPGVEDALLRHLQALPPAPPEEG